MTLQPLEDFVVARGLEDHTDSTTYYVRAVIRDAKTDVVITTLDLTDQGDGHRFTKKWQVPADQTGLGFYILITSSVYEDSGYTTKSQNYGDKYETYLVQQRMNPLLGGGGGGADLDYKRVRKIVEEAVSAKLAEAPQPEPVNLDFFRQPILNALSGLRNDIQAVDIPPADFSGVEYRLGLLEKAIKEIPKDDDSAVLKKLDDVEQNLLQEMDDSEEQVVQTVESTAKTTTDTVTKLADQTKSFEKKFDSAPVVVFQNAVKPAEAPAPAKETAPEPIDYQALLAR